MYVHNMLRLRMRLANLSIVCVHAPTEDRDSPPQDKDSFYDNLDNLMGAISEYDVRLVIDDFNARAGKNQTDLCNTIGAYSCHETATDNGE